MLHSTGDVVSSAPELARLTLNIAATHHDSRVGGRRLVYGGHTIGLAWVRPVESRRMWSPCSAGIRVITPGRWGRRHRVQRIHVEAAEALPVTVAESLR